jgi:hypothetical protein
MDRDDADTIDLACDELGLVRNVIPSDKGYRSQGFWQGQPMACLDGPLARFRIRAGGYKHNEYSHMTEA